jgi:2-polyprenyl-3-methyl-5-hydroxy-6-metoxy-1,4-benzoquinol methylase
MQTAHVWTASDLNWKTLGSFPYYHCKNCGALFRPAGSTLSAGAYPRGYGTCLKPESPLIQSRIDSIGNRRRAEFLESIRKPGTILDVGCGSGFFLAYLRMRGWQVHGLESAAEHVAFARDVLGLTNVIQGTWPPANGFSRQFDAVTMIHLIEHMLDPLTALTAVRHSLPDGGTVLLETPNIASWPARIFGPRWVTLDAPRHMVLFDSKSLKYFLRAAEFEKIRMISYSPSTMEWSESLRYTLPHLPSANRKVGFPASLRSPLFDGSNANGVLNNLIIPTAHAGERLIYRLINAFADTVGSGNNLLAIACNRA